MTKHLEWLKRWPRFGIMTGSLGSLLVVGLLDYLTGIEVSVTAFYLVPVSLSTWFGGRQAGMFMACASAVVWLGADVLGRASLGHPFVSIWNAAMLGLEFVAVAYLLGALKDRNQHLEQTVALRTEELRRSLVELQQTQQQLIEAAKLESVGRLAAGIAHEVKNPLMTLSLGADYFLSRQTENADESVLAQDMKEAVRRASNIVNQLLDYSRPRPLQSTREDINQVIETALNLVRPQLKTQDVTVVRELQDGLPTVMLDRARIEQVLVNLFLNAIQAMPEGGTLTVRSSATALSTNGSDAARVDVEIEDTGDGIARENLNRIFDPFFTTKPIGRGTGLGLAIARTIIEIHGGTINLANRAEGGVKATLGFNVGPETEA